MTTSGRRWAFVIGVLVALALPKRVETPHGRCTDYVVEPFGVYLLGQIVDVGLAYSSGRDCR